MPKISLAAVIAHCDKILRTGEIGDYDGAVNGLQVENAGTVSRLAAAVDASFATVKLAIAARADLLLVHHGLFWSPSHPWTGKKHELLRRLIQNNLAVYSSHLPIDAHPKLGNNAQLCAALGFKNLKPFFQTHGQTIGFQTRLSLSRAELARRLARATGAKPRIIPGGGDICRRIGVVTGGAGDDLKLAAAEGVDTFIPARGRIGRMLWPRNWASTCSTAAIMRRRRSGSRRWRRIYPGRFTSRGLFWIIRPGCKVQVAGNGVQLDEVRRVETIKSPHNSIPKPMADKLT